MVTLIVLVILLIVIAGVLFYIHSTPGVEEGWFTTMLKLLFGPV